MGSHYYKNVKVEEVGKNGQDCHTRHQHAEIPQELGHVGWQDDTASLSRDTIVESEAQEAVQDGHCADRDGTHNGRGCGRDGGKRQGC